MTHHLIPEHIVFGEVRRYPFNMCFGDGDGNMSIIRWIHLDVESILAFTLKNLQQFLSIPTLVIPFLRTEKIIAVRLVRSQGHLIIKKVAERPNKSDIDHRQLRYLVWQILYDIIRVVH